MTGDPSAVLTRRSGLLERAVHYARRVVSQVRRTDLARPTPCDRWDLLDLMRHLNESVATLREAVDHGGVFPEPAPAGPGATDALRTFDVQTGLLLAAWSRSSARRSCRAARRTQTNGWSRSWDGVRRPDPGRQWAPAGWPGPTGFPN